MPESTQRDENEPSKMWPGQVTDGSHRTWCGDSRCGDAGHARERLSFLQGVEMAALSERELVEMDDLLAILDVPDSSYRTLAEELAELERTNPEVAAASRKYDEAVARILGRCPTCGSDNAGNRGVACTSGSMDPWHTPSTGSVVSE